MKIHALQRLCASLGIAALAFGLSGCAGNSTAEKNTVTFATGDAEPTCLDPHVGGNFPQALAGNQFLESLFSKNSDGEIIPWLATSAKVASDKLSWTVSLREGVKFQDGTDFNADAVVANVNHMKDPNTKSSTAILAMSKVKQVVPLDAHTVRFDLSEPDGALIESLAQTWTAMESPAGIKRGEEANCAHPYGTGPFQVENWEQKKQITFTRYEGYKSAPADAKNQEGAAKIEKIVWQFIPESSTRLAALKSGQVDVIDSVQPDALAQLEKDSNYGTAVFARPGTTARIELNTRRAPFNDDSVRQAFIKGMDIDPAIKSLYHGTLERSYSILSDSVKFGVQDPDMFTPDTDAANKLLDKAGWTDRDTDGVRMKDGKRLTVSFPLSTNQSIPAEQSLVQQIADQEKKVGFDVKIELLDLSSWYAASGDWTFDAIIAPYSKTSPDVLRTVYSSSAIEPAPSGYHANNTGWSSPELDAVLDQASQEDSDSVRGPLYEKAQRMILDSHTVIPLYGQMVQTAYTKDLAGYRLQPQLGVPTFLDASWK
ncbi:ABC transporter substrate-binding protein [Neoactinobaculum massilliense]|uniref:ABC transporter substrate-binding protein n=1 Tax=Neoactinobaculum massilliense TaxID=2364794 RepID=UPI001F14B3BE|nr:ABC transporter substrate-binding protein [Neoactinobaculum massilliense]